MCCCCVTVSLNLLSNLVQRTADDIMELIYCQRRRCPASPSSGSLNSMVVAAEDQYQCDRHLHQLASTNDQEQRIVQHHHDEEDPAETNTWGGNDPLVEMPSPLLAGSSFYNVIYDTVELEPYFWAVDRAQSEELLQGTPDGSCLVRPFKMKHHYIRYILSVHAAGTYFHLFIRLTTPNGLYALGLVKQKERRFKFPTDIVQYYRSHRLECSSISSNSNSAITKIRLHLLPMIVNQSSARGDVEGVVITQREENVIK